MNQSLEKLRGELNHINQSMLTLLNRRAKIVTEVHEVKRKNNIPIYIPEREMEMLKELVKHNDGPFSDETVLHIFKEIFRASVSFMEERQTKKLRVSRQHRENDFTIKVNDITIGKDPLVIAGPCSVESEEQMDIVGRGLKELGIKILRGGAFKPRSNPYSFQGLGEPGLKLLRDTAKKYGFVSVTEVIDVRSIDLVSSYADILQVGARNMFNYELLRELGRTRKPIFLKRAFSATIEEFLYAAEYIVMEGNDQVVLCERGIRTFETQTRNTLDISAIPLLKNMTYLPVMVDVSHAAGRKDILASLGRASIAAGADGIMVEVHPCPPAARSDASQQLDLDEFAAFLCETGFHQKRFKVAHGA